MEDNLSLEQKLVLLTSLAADDREGPPPPRLRNTSTKKVGALRPLNIRTVRVGTWTTSLLRVLMTNACSYNCHYCPMRRDRNMPRTLLKPEELVKIFLAAHARGWCQGLFITTGIPGRPTKIIDDLIQVLELLRGKHRFGGYIHVKMPPGGEPAQIERLTALASRVSINLETPCGQTLEHIAPEKNLDQTLVSLERSRTLVNHAREAERDGRRRDPLSPGGVAGMTMQFVVGATADNDRSIMGRVTALYAGGGIHHAHFSAFRPIRDTPMESQRATPALREHRLYQVDYLLRQYGFSPEEIVYGAGDNIPLTNDPKTTWALAHPERFPVELSNADLESLLRVPGVGPTSARRIVEGRRGTTIRGLSDLRRLGVVTSRAAGFVAIRGRRLSDTRWAEQLGIRRPEDEIGTRWQAYEVSPGTFR